MQFPRQMADGVVVIVVSLFVVVVVVAGRPTQTQLFVAKRQKGKSGKQAKPKYEQQ